jgi:hypothetical protein
MPQASAARKGEVVEVVVVVVVVVVVRVRDLEVWVAATARAYVLIARFACALALKSC